MAGERAAAKPARGAGKKTAKKDAKKDAKKKVGTHKTKDGGRPTKSARKKAGVPPSSPSSGPEAEADLDVLAHPEELEPSRTMRKWVRSQFKHGPHWHFERILNKARVDQGKIHYTFHALDSDRNVTDRIVVRFWDLGAQGTLPGARKERVQDIEEFVNEVDIQLRILTLRCSHILRYRGASERRVDGGTDPVALYLYTQLAEGGTLENVLDAHDPEEYWIPIPEHHIWYTFQCLVQALISIRYGSVCRDPTRPPGRVPMTTKAPKPYVHLKLAAQNWAPIVHRDIKDVNIFLGDFDEKYKFYRRPLLSDFGLGKILHDYKDVDKDPKVVMSGQIFRDRADGTEFWHAPEQISPGRVINPRTGQLAKVLWALSEFTDIYAVGLVVWNMVHASHHGNWRVHMQQNHWTDLDAEGLDLAKLLPESSKSRGRVGIEADLPLHLTMIPPQYSFELISLIHECVRFDPRARPDLMELEHRIDTALQRLDRELGADKIQSSTPPDGLKVHYKKRSEFDGKDEPSPSPKRRSEKGPSPPRKELDEARDEYDEYEAMYSQKDGEAPIDADVQAAAIRAVHHVVRERGWNVRLQQFDLKFEQTKVLMMKSILGEQYKGRSGVDVTWDSPTEGALILDAYSEASDSLLAQSSEIVSEFKRALEMAKHAADWGVLLYAIGKPKMKKPSLEQLPVHRAVVKLIGATGMHSNKRYRHRQSSTRSPRNYCLEAA
ncbi:kinase-like protein [Polyplosphaeria fusca]|uniref:non-specific serine/threonine protein kinase n=1 Tax=Polyplosphaeria fusca TaxID=682080 RepID=A0A9P4QVM7_9PLEO|nr:kinase-like protein [Polyplosphaeria fusca]